MNLFVEMIKNQISTLEDNLSKLKEKFRVELNMKNVKIKKRSKLRELLLTTTNKKTIYLRFDGNWQTYKSVKNGYVNKMTFWNTGESIKELSQSIALFIKNCEDECNRVAITINFEKTNRPFNVKIVNIDNTIE